MCVYACACVLMHTCMYVCGCMCVCLYACMHVCMCACMIRAGRSAGQREVDFLFGMRAFVCNSVPQALMNQRAHQLVAKQVHISYAMCWWSNKSMHRLPSIGGEASPNPDCLSQVSGICPMPLAVGVHLGVDLGWGVGLK